jgi:hypothetical protein
MHGLDSQQVQDVVALIVLIGGIIVYARGRVPQQTIKNLLQLTDAYEKRIKALEEELKDNHQIQLKNVAAIGELQGQVTVYKELPLQELADGIKEVVKISRDNAQSNQAILEQLQKTAVIAEEDRDVLTNQNLHIKTEVHRVMDKDITKQP